MISRLHDERIKEMEKNKSNKEIIENFEIKYKEYEKIHEVKQRANDALVGFRNERTTKLSQKARVMQRLVIDSKGPNNDPDKVNLLDVLMHDRDNICDSPKFALPEAKEQLWVVKPIGKYEPSTATDTMDIKRASLDPDVRPSDRLPDLVPKTHKEKKDCEMELDGSDLQKIQIDAKELVFGDVFKSSDMYKTFWIKNNLRNHIFIQLETEVMELKKR